MSVTTEIPSVLLTDKQGPSQRLRVDPGQTGFFAGRMFRTFLDSVIPVAGPSVQVRFVSPINFILWSQVLTLTQGAVQLEVYTSATDLGGWTTALPIIGINRMTERPTPLYTPLITIDTGGNFSGGTLVDKMIINAGSNIGNQSSQNAGGETTERGLPAGTYFIRLGTLTGGIAPIDASHSLYTLTWEERV